MATRIELELTSQRDDGSFTWRAAGAKQPKGVVDAGLLPDGAKVGDVLRAEADYLVDGIEITSVQAPKAARGSSFETLEILGSGRREDLVTTRLYKGNKGRGGRDRGRGGRDRGGEGRSGGGRGDRGGRSDRGGRGDRGGRRQQAPRLRPANVHRTAWLDSCNDIQRPIAEQLIDGGMPSVRAAIDRQNETARAEDRPEINGTALLQMAEGLAPALKTAEWRDRAEAAITGVDTIDVRDLRSVLASAESGARDPESREMADTLRTKMNARLERENTQWQADIRQAIADGRVVRALRSSARPAKPGTPMPADLARNLLDATNAAMSEDEEPGRWATVLDAVAFSPIRELVQPAGVPDLEDRELVRTVKKLSSRVPQIAALFGIEPKAEPRREPRKGSSGGRDGDAKGGQNANDDAASAGAVEASEAPATDAPAETAAEDATEPAAPVQEAADGGSSDADAGSDTSSADEAASEAGES